MNKNCRKAGGTGCNNCTCHETSEDIIKKNEIGFLIGNAMKALSKARRNKEQQDEEIKKAQMYIDKINKLNEWLNATT